LNAHVETPGRALKLLWPSATACASSATRVVWSACRIDFDVCSTRWQPVGKKPAVATKPVIRAQIESTPLSDRVARAQA
jgi:hypothetical protein